MKEVCRYDGSCHNAAPEHWVRFQHSKQSEARPLKRSLDEWLKDEEEHTPSSSSGCVLVPETPSPAQKTKMTARDLGEVMWNSKCVYAPVSEKKKGAIAASAKKQRVVGDELKSRRRDTDVSEALTPEILDRDDPKRSAEKKGKSVLASGSDSDEDVVRGVKAKQLAKNGLKPRKTMILESDSEDDGKLLGPGQISVGHDIDKEELQPACKKKKRALLLSDDDQDHDDTEPLLVKKGSDGNVVDLTSQQDTKWAESEVQHEMEEEYEEEDEEDVNEDVQEVVEECEKIGEGLSDMLGALFESGKDKSGRNIIEQPACLGSNELRLKPYQLVGMSWMSLMHYSGVNGILADEMGLGKTIQSIAFLASLHEKGESGPHMIVTSASTLSNWAREFDLWLPVLRVVHYHGSMKERESLRYNKCIPGEYDVIITTYSYFQNDAAVDDRKFLRRIPFKVLILDEGHSIKNAESSRYKRLLQIGSDRRFLLTGTPINNNLPELLVLLQFLMPDLFSNENDSLRVAFNEKEVGHARFAKRVKRMLTTFVLRRRKCDVLGELVPKKDVVLKLKLTDSQQKTYDGIFNAWRQEMQSREAATSKGVKQGKGASAMAKKSMKNVFFSMRQAANHPLLVRSLVSDSQLEDLAKDLHKIGQFGTSCSREQVLKEISKYSDWDLHNCCLENKKRFAKYILGTGVLCDSAKLQKIAELLPQLKADGHRILLFSQWTTMLDIIEVLLQKMEIHFIRLDGSTPVADRQELIDRYNGDPSILVFLLSTRAGGLGINLTAADTVIMHDLDFNPQTDRQAEDRCHRIGQTKPVTVIRLVCEGTVDEKIFSLAESKKELANGMLDDVDQEVQEAEDVDVEKDASLNNIISEVLNQMLKVS